MSTQFSVGSQAPTWLALTIDSLYRHKKTQGDKATNNLEENLPLLATPALKQPEKPVPDVFITSEKPGPSTSQPKADDPELTKLYAQILAKKAAVEDVLAQRPPAAKDWANMRQASASDRAYNLLLKQEMALINLGDQINAQVVRRALTELKKNQLAYHGTWVSGKKAQRFFEKVLSKCPDRSPPLYESIVDNYWDIAYEIDEKMYKSREGTLMPNMRQHRGSLLLKRQVELNALEQHIQYFSQNIKELTTRYNRDKQRFLESKQKFCEALK